MKGRQSLVMGEVSELLEKKLQQREIKRDNVVSQIIVCKQAAVVEGLCDACNV